MKLCDDLCICFPKRREKRARRDPGCLLLVMEEARPAGPVYHLFLKGCECHLSNSIGKMKHDKGPQNSAQIYPLVNKFSFSLVLPVPHIGMFETHQWLSLPMTQVPPHSPKHDLCKCTSNACLFCQTLLDCRTPWSTYHVCSHSSMKLRPFLSDNCLA